MGEGGGFALLYPALPSDRKRCCPGHLQRTYFPWTVTWQAFDVTLAGIAQITHHCLKKNKQKKNSRAPGWLRTVDRVGEALATELGQGDAVVGRSRLEERVELFVHHW